METLFYAYACFTCKDRGPDLAEAANDYGFTARYIVGGKLRLSKMTIPEIQDEIRVPELVVLVTEPIAAWREDYELTEKVKDILERAGRNYRSDTFTSLLRELVINGVKR